MNRTEKEQMIIGNISLLSNKLTQMGDEICPDITYKQFFILLVISKMELEEKNINSIAELVGTTRQNVKFEKFSLDEIDSFVKNLEKLMDCL